MKDLLSRLKSMLGGEPAAADTHEVSPPPAGATDQADDTVLINAYCTVGVLPPADFPHTRVAGRDSSDPELADHLQGFVGYIAARGDGQMTSTRYHLIRHVERVRHHLSLDIPATGLDAFADWALRANAVAFLPDGSIRDPYGRLLMDAGGNPPDPEAVVPYPQDAWERKARTDTQLAARGGRLPAHLPPVLGEAEVRLRRADEVLGRASALCAVAFRAKTVHSDDPIPVADLFERLPHGSSCLTPNEAAFMGNPAPDEETAVELSWRFECVPVLEWALGLRDDLPYPDGTADVPLALLDLSPEAMADLPAKVRLRPAAEILDALDLHYRAHWLVRQARIDNVAPPAGLAPGVVGERHHALNWLVHFEDAEWDQVDTPT